MNEEVALTKAQFDKWSATDKWEYLQHHYHSSFWPEFGQDWKKHKAIAHPQFHHFMHLEHLKEAQLYKKIGDTKNAAKHSDWADAHKAEALTLYGKSKLPGHATVPKISPPEPKEAKKKEPKAPPEPVGPHPDAVEIEDHRFVHGKVYHRLDENGHDIYQVVHGGNDDWSHDWRTILRTVVLNPDDDYYSDPSPKLAPSKTRDPQSYYEWKDYTGNGYASINNKLRGNPNSETAQKLKKSLLKNCSPSDKEYSSYRGVKSNFNYEEGKVYRANAPTSTSVRAETATSFSGGDNTGKIIRFHIPKGAKIAWLQPMSKHPGENELALAPDTHFKVIEQRTIKLEIISPLKKFPVYKHTLLHLMEAEVLVSHKGDAIHANLD